MTSTFVSADDLGYDTRNNSQSTRRSNQKLARFLARSLVRSLVRSLLELYPAIINKVHAWKIVKAVGSPPINRHIIEKANTNRV